MDSGNGKEMDLPKQWNHQMDRKWMRRNNGIAKCNEIGIIMEWKWIENGHRNR